MATVEQWKERFDALTDDSLQDIAIIRMVEVTNGCIQMAFREKDIRALDVEKTRAAMQLSMGIIINKVVTVSEDVFTPLSPEIDDIMNEVRELYVKGFKNGDDEKFAEFMRASKANVLAVGKDRLDQAEKFVRQHFTDTLTEEYITYGRSYLDNLAKS